MEESFENAVQELKRVDHLFWVSLKYTRTVDVIRNTVERLINLYDFGLDSVLRYAKANKFIAEVPKIPLHKADAVKKALPQFPELAGYADLYVKLRKILNSEYTKREEYRRHVTMTVFVDSQQIEVNIDYLKEQYETSREFIRLVRGIIKGGDDQ